MVLGGVRGTITQPRLNLKPGTNRAPTLSNDNDKLEEMHMQHKPFCRLNPNYGVDLIKMQQTSIRIVTRGAWIQRAERAPGVESAARDQVR